MLMVWSVLALKLDSPKGDFANQTGSITDFFNNRNMSLGESAHDTNLNCFLFKRLISKLNN